MTITSQRRHIAALITIFAFGDKMPSILDPGQSGADWVIDQHISPKEVENGYLAAREEERVVKSAMRPVSDDVLDWIEQEYVDQGERPSSVQASVARPSLGVARPRPSLLDAPEAYDPADGLLSAGHRPLAPEARAQTMDIRPLYRDEDEFASIISAVGHSKDPLSLDPFPKEEFPVIEGKQKPASRSSQPFGDREPYDQYVEAAAKHYGVDPDLVRAMIQAESNWNPEAASPAGAVGLMQIIPSTAEHLGVKDRRDPEQSIWGGTRYIAELLRRYDGDWDKAIAAYNAGPGAVDKHGGIPPFRETKNYVPRVRGYYERYRRGEL